MNVGYEFSFPWWTGPLPGGVYGPLVALREESFILGILGKIYNCKPDKNTWKGD